MFLTLSLFFAKEPQFSPSIIDATLGGSSASDSSHNLIRLSSTYPNRKLIDEYNKARNTRYGNIVSGKEMSSGEHYCAYWEIWADSPRDEKDTLVGLTHP